MRTFDEVYWVNYHNYEDLQLYEVGCQKCPPSYGFGPIIRNEYVFHYIYEGEGVLYIDNKEFHLTKDQAFVLPANILTYYEASATNPWNYVWIKITGPKAVELLQKAGMTRRHPIFVSTEPCQRIGLCLGEILKNHDQEYLCMGKLYEMFHFLIDFSSHRQEEGSKEEPKSRYIQIVMDYIANKYSEPIRIKEIADVCGLERSYLSKVFKYGTGQTPQEYLLQFRMNKARQLLKNPDISVQNVSYSVGYNDPFSFSKLFKREMGMSPTQWRKSRIAEREGK